MEKFVTYADIEVVNAEEMLIFIVQVLSSCA
jgi:hypothetical protein